MDERVVLFRVGVVVIATVLIAAILVLMFGDITFFMGKGQYTVRVTLAQAPGVMEGTPVHKFGKTIGRVRRVDVTDEHAVVTLSIGDDVRLDLSSRCRVKTTILGDATIDFVRADKPLSKEYLKDGATIEGDIADDPLALMAKLATTVTNLEEDARIALNSVGDAGEKIGKLADRLNDILAGSDGELDGIGKKIEASLDNFNTAMTSLNNIVGDKEVQENLKKALSDLPELMETTRETMDEFKRVAISANENLDYLKGFTEPLGENGPEMAAHIRSSARKMDDLLTQLNTFSEALNNQDGSLGQFVHNPDLYQHLNRAAMNFEQLSLRLRPITEDARIFMDKLARDPGQLGVRGAFKRPSGIK